VGPEKDGLLQESHLHGVGRLVNIFRLPPFGSARRNYRVNLQKRGVYPLGPVRVESGDPFGLYTESKDIGDRDQITVYPEMARFPQLDFPSASPFGDKKRSTQAFRRPQQADGRA